MVLNCTIRDEEICETPGLEALEQASSSLDLWTEMTSCEGWQRPAAEQLDRLTSDVASVWARASAAAGELLGVEQQTAILAAHLLTVPTDLVLWVLTTLPVPHRSLRKTILQELPKRLGIELAYQADFPPVIRSLFEGRESSALGAALHIGRRILPSAEVWPKTIAGSDASLVDVVPADDFSKAAGAAKNAIG
jgi:hypothetical protein